ncbi:MAG: hypothetical protein JWO67_4699 [Streptosporangiaceae bacterium]|nr:hypothetical protein [Streptosporangiaceae bacterium]
MTTYRPGSFFLTAIPGWSGFAIALGQTLARSPSRYSHAGIVLDADGTVLEAEPGGARIANLSEYAGRPLLICDGPVQQWMRNRAPWQSEKGPEWSEDYIRGAVVRAARKLVGVPYSALDYAALAALHLHLPSRWIRHRVETSGKAICSQLVDLCYQRAGIHLWDDGRLPGDVMPADLAAWADDWRAKQ